MIDRIFSLVLLFCILAGGTAAVGSELLTQRTEVPTSTAIASLPRVVVTGRKQPTTTAVARADHSEGVTRSVE